MGAILYTEGGELQYLDGREYIGPYHIMPDGTPMGGAVHTGNEDILKFSDGRATVVSVSPNSFATDGFELADQSIIPSFNVNSVFDPTSDRIEYFIYDDNRTILYSNSNFKNYRIQNNLNISDNEIEEILLFPENDITNQDYINGSLTGLYNFITPEIPNIFISEISSDRTEIRLQSNTLSSEEIREQVNSLKTKIDSENYFDEFYLNLGNNNYYIAVNILLDTTTTPTSFLVKLYEPLPSNVPTKTRLEIVSKVSETQAFRVTFPDREIPTSNLISIKGPNVNLPFKDKVNNSTELQSLSTLTTSSFTSSLDQSRYLLNQTGISLNPSYSISSYGDFVHFSSAKKRVENFYYKVGQIQSFEQSISNLRTITGASSGSTTTTSSIQNFQSKITDIIRNFDGFEYFLYYESGSDAYPKSNDTAPYTLQASSSTEVLNWLGSDNESSAFYGGALLSASLFDDNNSSNLINTIPEFIRENSDNNNYFDFTHLVGQHFDEIWLYIKAITDKLKNSNNLETGIAPELVEETLKSFGYEVYGNNFDNNDIFTGLIGISDTGTYFPETGEELITTAISASNNPIPINNVSKEIYKRLYHNLVYLAKRKGTISGLRSLINIWGLPDTILRIYEFGGKDKINNNNWDSYRRIFNKEIVSNQHDADLGTQYNGGVLTKWKIHPNWSSASIDAGVTGSVPATVEFRFKSDINSAVTPSQSIPLQPLWGLKDDAGDTKVLVYLEYEGSGSFSGSFSGSAIDPNYQYANLTLAVSGSPPTSASISLPFYNQDWWNVRVQMQELGLASPNESRYQLASANKIYNGKDGTQIGFESSTKLQQISGSWVNSTVSNFFQSRSFNDKQYTNFSGSLQEIRYWTLCFNNQTQISESVWDNHVMDPLSIETGHLTGSFSPVESLIFRSREGEDLSLISGSLARTNQDKDLQSIHPKVTSSFSNVIPVTPSFPTDSLYSLETASISNNIEIQFLNPPNLGIKTRVTDKIQTYNNVAYENVLSQYRSIQQNYEVSQSFTEDNNLLQIAFSPQDEVNDDIIHEFGFNNTITDTLSDPRNLSSSLDFYTGLRHIAEKYFEKYLKGNANDYYRLIKYIDNSLFKAIKNYVPARTSVSTGIVVKQHLLERNRVRPPQVNPNTIVAKTPETGSFVKNIAQQGLNSPLVFKDITLTGSIKSQPKGYTTGSSIQRFSGGTGGSFEKFNNIRFHPYGTDGTGPSNIFKMTQSFSESVSTLSGSIVRIIDNQDEFYNGEFNGTVITVTTQSLNGACIKYHNVLTTPPATASFDYFLYNELFTSSIASFANSRTAPNAGEMFIGYNSAGPYLRGLKVSTTDKEGNNVTNVLNNATRLSFNFGPSIENYDVTPIGQGPGFIQYEINQSLTSQPEYLLSSSFENYPFLASASVALSSSVGVGTTFFQPFGATTTITLADYAFENDPDSLFNKSTGIYRVPATPNLIIKYTGSVNYTGSIRTNTVSTLLDSSSLKLQLKSQTLPPFTKYVDVREFNTGAQTNLTFTGSFLVSGSFNGLDGNVPLKDDELSLELSLTLPPLRKNTNFISGSITGSGALFSISTGSRLPFPADTRLISFEPYIPGGLNAFEHDFDCQPLLNNVIVNRPSTLYFDVDYTFGSITPVNIFPILNFDAEPARTPDSNYTQKSRILSRYEGSKATSLRLNEYNEKGVQYYEKGRLKIWTGDISYGKTPVIQRYKPYFGYFQLLIPTSPELELATQAKLKYLIGLDGQVFKPILNSPSFFDVEGTFETGDIVDVSLEDTLQTDDPSLVNAAVGINLDNFNKSSKVIRGARRVDPILTTQVKSIYDDLNQNNPSSVFQRVITMSNPLGITSDYSVFASTPFGTQVDVVASPQRVDFVNEVIDRNNQFNIGTDEFVFSEIPQCDIDFRARLHIRNNSNSDQDVMLRIVRERGGVRSELASETLTVPANSGFPGELFDVRTGFRDFLLSDKVYARVSTQQSILTPVTAVDDLIPTPGLNVAIVGGAFTVTPKELPSISFKGPFWTTGSNYANYLTSSLSMSLVYNEVQTQYSESTFKPINEPFTIQVGDEFRFQGREDKVFLVNKVIPKSEENNTSGSILVRVDPVIPPLLNLDQFLIRRYNPDGTSVLIDLNPPSSSFVTTKGIIKNVAINEELEESINKVVSNLSQEGTI